MEPEHSELIKTQIKVEALLMEYDKLRDELVSRMNSRFAVIGYIGAMVAFAISQSGGIVWPETSWPLSLVGLPKEIVWPAALVVLGLLFFLFVWRRFGSFVKQLSRRISAIELQVNELIGEEVLIWETRQIKSGIFHRL